MSQTTLLSTDDLVQPTKSFHEAIGDKEWLLTERTLDVYDEVALWSDNPRLQTHLVATGATTESELEAALQNTKGFDPLLKSIDELGQMTPIYVQETDTGKFLVLEGATRVTILRQLDRKYQTGTKQGVYRRVKAKILPANFSETDRAVLLASIHVRGSGVRDWERYIQAKFVYETISSTPGKPALMNGAQLARYMGKSEAWVNRLKHAFEFALKFMDHVDNEDAATLASKNFSTLEEISRAKLIGSQLRDYENSKHDTLRDEVFTMVENEVFKEYRDARFMKEFYDDLDKWDQLKSGEKHIANKLASEVKSNSSGPKAKIASLPQMVKRSIDRGEAEFDEEDISALQQVLADISNEIHEGIRPFRIELKRITTALSEASMADVKEIELDEIASFNEALEHFQYLVNKHGKKAQ
ncbi:MAG: hypothetical protein AAGI12_14085 [Pseudomonadota bacterium]